MTEHAEIAGFIQVKFLYGEKNINEWLQKNADLEILEIKVIPLNLDVDGAMIIYRNDY